MTRLAGTLKRIRPLYFFVVLILAGCYAERSYGPWEQSAEEKLRRSRVSVYEMEGDEKDLKSVSQSEIQDLRKAKEYVRSNLPVEHIKWTYNLDQVDKIVNVWLGPEYIYAETSDYQLWAINRQNGRPEWKFSLHGRLDYRPSFVHGIPQEKLKAKRKISELQNKLAAARAERNPDQDQIQDLSSRLDQQKNRRQNLLEDDRIYLIVGTTLYVVDREFGSQIDRVSLDFAPAARPFATRSRVLIPAYGRNFVHFIRAGDMVEMTEERIQTETPLEVPVSYVGELYLFPTSGGTLYAVNQEGNWQWYKKTDGEITASPKIWEDNVYLVSHGMQVYGLSRFTGNNVWTQQLSTTISTSPWISPPNLYVRDDNNRFYAFDLESGDLQWKKSEGPKSFLFRKGEQIFTHDPSNKNVFAIADDTGEIVETGNYKPFSYVLTNNRNPVFFLADDSGTFVAARASNLGIEFTKENVVKEKEK